MRKDRLIAFFSGDLFVTIAAVPVVQNIVMAAVLGVIGGMFGLLGKDMYKVLKEMLRPWAIAIKNYLKKSKR